MSKKFLLVGLVLVIALGVVWIAGAQGDDDTERPFVGVAIRSTNGGVQIVSVTPNSPAEEAGLQIDEYIVSVDGTEIEDVEQLTSLIQGYTPGDIVTFVVRNDDGEREVEVEIGATSLPEIDIEPVPDFDAPRDEDDRRGPVIRIFENMQPYQLGVSFRTLTPEIAAEEGVDAAEGALVMEVVEGSPADDAGILVGDVIVSVDGDVVDVERTLSDRLFAYEAEDQVTLEVLRDGETLEIGVVLAAEHPARRGMFMPGGLPNIFELDPNIRDFEFEGLPDFENLPDLENFRIEISTEPPAQVDEGFQILECGHGEITFYVTLPDGVPAVFGCEPYEE
ncbi:MAG: PDZ domain-containing protein [Chloroflexi bacterium]|nr:PDZ domain-containing protein [Chloroflexota bacterium]